MKIAIAMSGGIDSSMAAVLLKEQGHEVIGITAVLTGDQPSHGGPLSSDAATDAKETADALGFRHHTIDLREDFSGFVIQPFCEAYRSGSTPNPCVECNVMIKFGKLMEASKALGCDKIATGHYVRLKPGTGGRLYLSMNRDRSKDQSYFLYRLSQEQLKNAVFPLGEYTKDEVRNLAARHNLAKRERPESQEICFIPDNDYPAFIAARACAPVMEGEIVDGAGRVRGTHRGIHRYTIGQRRGLGISSDRPLYVTGIDAPRNRIIVGGREELAVSAIILSGLALMKAGDLRGVRALVKTRSTQPPVWSLIRESGGEIIAVFDDPQYGVSPGQSAVFYDEDRDLLGGGYIEGSIALPSLIDF